MLTRSAVLKQYLAEDSESSSSSHFESAESDSGRTKSEYDSHTSTRTLISKPAMEEATAALAAPLRKKLERIQNKIIRLKDRLSRQRELENPASSDSDTLKDMQSQLELQQKEHDKLSEELYNVETNPTAITDDEARSDEFEQNMLAAVRDLKYLMSQRKIHSNAQAVESAIRGLTAAYEASPDNDHTGAMTRLLLRTEDLEGELLLSLMEEEEELRGRANNIVERSYILQSRVAGIKATDVKPTIRGTSKSNVKLKHIDIPSFRCKTEDWLPFKRLFYKAVHQNEDLDDDTRMTYLVQAMADPRVKADFSERMDEENAYKKILKELDEEHDKPRWMHRRYCVSMKNLSTNPHTREGMKNLISQVTIILNGFIRLKAENCRYILTSIVEAVMDAKLRALWNQRTDKQKTTPPIEDLLQFIKDQADQLEDSSSSISNHNSHQEKKAGHHQSQRFKGGTHSVVSTVPVSSNRGSQQSHQQQQPSREPFTSNSSTCSLCQGSHHVFYCPTFEGYSVSQRKEHVMQQKLCLNCLKPNHVAHDCRSNYRCKAQDCGRKHNTLLHDERPAASVQQTSTHQANAAIHVEKDEDDDLEECLLMTSQTTLTGPTGKSITVRALLDSGSYCQPK